MMPSKRVRCFSHGVDLLTLRLASSWPRDSKSKCADHTVQRRADFMAHRRQEVFFGLGGCFGLTHGHMRNCASVSSTWLRSVALHIQRLTLTLPLAVH